MELRELRPDPARDLYERRSSRFAPIVLRQLIILVAVAIVVTLGGILLYSPLAAGPAAVAGDTVRTESRDHTVAFAPGETFEYSYALTNAGRWGVTIRGIEPPRHATLASTDVLMLTPAGPARVGGFSLAPGQSQRILVRSTFARCAGPRPAEARNTWSSASIRFSILSVPRTAEVDLPFSITIDAGAAEPC